MNKIRLHILAVCLAVLMAGAAFAQLDPSTRLYLYENGIRVGEIFVEPRAEGQTHYIEHWVLYPNYQYPGPKFIGELRIVPSPTEKPYESTEEFFRKVRFEKGSRYIRVTADEYDALPATR